MSKLYLFVILFALAFSNANAEFLSCSRTVPISELGISDEMISYIKRLHNFIINNWNQPYHLAKANLYVDVDFTVSKEGVISNVKIRYSSKNDEFNQTVIDAFKQIGNVENPPSNQAESFCFRFELTEDTQETKKIK